LKRGYSVARLGCGALSGPGAVLPYPRIDVVRASLLHGGQETSERDRRIACPLDDTDTNASLARENESPRLRREGCAVVIDRFLKRTTCT
jgi:hypothetical protein